MECESGVSKPELLKIYTRKAGTARQLWALLGVTGLLCWTLWLVLDNAKYLFTLDTNSEFHPHRRAAAESFKTVSITGEVCTIWNSVSCRPLVPELPLVNYSSLYFWAPTSWGPCSKNCGGGLQVAIMECFTTGFVKTDYSDCGHLQSPEIEQPCNIGFCPSYSLHKLPWSECSRTCGTGNQTREIICLDNLGSIVDPINCGKKQSYLETQPCNTQPCSSSYWNVPRWSRCNAACGGGKRERMPTCNLNGTQVAASACSSITPATVEGCNSQPCQTHAWLAGPWQDCSNESQESTNRLVQCVNGLGIESSEDMCNGMKPKSTMSCKNWTSGCSSIGCLGKGICQEGVCSCYDDWQGMYCDRPKSCSRHLGYLSNGTTSCCQLVDLHQQCCSSLSAVLDKDGYCCESGTLDQCGLCDGKARSIDSQGKCCATIRDEKGICCESGMLDDCHVCNGDGTSCATNMTLYLNVTNYSTDLESLNLFTWFLLSSMDHVASKLKLGDNSVSVAGIQVRSMNGETCDLTSLDISPCLQQSVFIGHVEMNITVIPTSRDIYIQRPDVAVVLGPGTLLTSPIDVSKISYNVTILSLLNVKRSGICGNGICEQGERCTSTGESASTGTSSCCLQDCPYVSSPCPAGKTPGAPCSGHGMCMDTTGQCSCFEGYGGIGCSYCLPGWTLSYNESCVKLPDATTLANMFSSFSTSMKLSLPPQNAFQWRDHDIILVMGYVCASIVLFVALLSCIIYKLTHIHDNKSQSRSSPKSAPLEVPLPHISYEGIGSTPGPSHWSKSFLGAQHEFDKIPVTPMIRGMSISMQASTAGKTKVERKVSSPETSDPTGLKALSTIEDFTEEEQSRIAATVKKDSKRGQSAGFVTNYLTDSESESEDEGPDNSCGLKPIDQFGPVGSDGESSLLF